MASEQQPLPNGPVPPSAHAPSGAPASELRHDASPASATPSPPYSGQAPAAASSAPPQPAEPPLETAFLTAPSDFALEEQRERLRVLMDRGALVLAVVTVIVVVASLLNAVRGNFSVVHWIIALVGFGLTAALYYGAQHFGNRPENAVEVPAELAPLLNDITVVRAEVISSGMRVLDPEERIQVVREVDQKQQAAFLTAQRALSALREGDRPSAVDLASQVRDFADDVQQLRDQTFAEWDDEEIGFSADYVERGSGSAPSYDEYELPQARTNPSTSSPPSWSSPSIGRRSDGPPRREPYAVGSSEDAQGGSSSAAAAEAQESTAEATRHFWSARKQPRHGQTND